MTVNGWRRHPGAAVTVSRPRNLTLATVRAVNAHSLGSGPSFLTLGLRGVASVRLFGVTRGHSSSSTQSIVRATAFFHLR
jgi:hypothetical protein